MINNKWIPKRGEEIFRQLSSILSFTSYESLSILEKSNVDRLRKELEELKYTNNESVR